MENSDSLKLNHKFLGCSGLLVSNVCLGTIPFGRTGLLGAGAGGDVTDVAFDILDRYADLGGNFIDTADVYAFGKSEQIIGQWLSRQEREKFVISTKVRSPVDPTNPNKVGLSRRHITSNVDESLRRLGTHYIDLYQIQLWDEAVPLEETLRTLSDLVRCDKVRYIGICNATGWQLQKALDTSEYLNLHPVISLQTQYSLTSRTFEWELERVCSDNGVGVMATLPLASGRLFEDTKTGAGKSNGGTSQDTSLPVQVLRDEIKTIAADNNKTVSQVSIRWSLQKSIVASVVIYPTTIAELDDGLGASAGWSLSNEEMRKLDEFSSVKAPYPYDVMKMGNLGRYNRYSV
ncbi:hypothetical protein ScPMuIL_018350 [Solemya velum]